MVLVPLFGPFARRIAGRVLVLTCHPPGS